MIGIYKIVNPKGKIYIGQSININRRFDLYNKLICKQQPKLYNSLKKYGPENHKFEIIEKCFVQELNEKERYWQEFYNVIKEGLNLQLTNFKDKNGKQSQETKLKISKSKKGTNGYPKGRRRTEEFKNKLKRKRTIHQIENYKGPKSTQHIKNIKNNRPNKKKIYQFDLEGNFIKEWDCGKKASEILGINKPNIYSCANNKIKTSGGFIWKYHKK